MIKKCSLHHFFPFLIAFLVFIISSCIAPAPQVNHPNMSLANPATEKCLKDGYQSQSIKTHGVPTGGLCVNQIDHLACEEWAYYRGECQLTPVISTPSTSQRR